MRHGPAGALASLWAAARALQHAAASIAVRPGADTNLRYTTAAMHCGEAADELQRDCDAVATLDVGALGASAEGLPLAAASGILLAGIVTALRAVDLDDPRLRPRDQLAAATAGTWLALAHYAIRDQMP
jgi:hypothetical protein